MGLTDFLHNAKSMQIIEMDSIWPSDFACAMQNHQKHDNLASKIKGNIIPQFWSSSTGYIFLFDGVNRRKIPLKKKMTMS